MTRQKTRATDPDTIKKRAKGSDEHGNHSQGEQPGDQIQPRVPPHARSRSRRTASANSGRKQAALTRMMY
jgi:hypothetical protein